VVPTPGGAERPPTLRRLNTPRPVEVRTDADAIPSALLRHGRWLGVDEVLDRYRTDDRWWTAEPVSRTYYELLLEDGRMVTVFRDEVKGSWWEQRYG
jgi:hypothetical protein